MKKQKNAYGYGPVVREEPSFLNDSQRNTNRRPLILIILPILMVLVIIVTVYLAYRESKKGNPQPKESTSPSSVTESVD